jgi:hypothetical protein
LRHAKHSFNFRGHEKKVFVHVHSLGSSFPERRSMREAIPDRYTFRLTPARPTTGAAFRSNATKRIAEPSESSCLRIIDRVIEG